jgi:hypothetical protein
MTVKTFSQEHGHPINIDSCTAFDEIEQELYRRGLSQEEVEEKLWDMIDNPNDYAEGY